MQQVARLSPANLVGLIPRQIREAYAPIVQSRPALAYVENQNTLSVRQYFCKAVEGLLDCKSNGELEDRVALLEQRHETQEKIRNVFRRKKGQNLAANDQVLDAALERNLLGRELGREFTNQTLIPYLGRIHSILNSQQGSHAVFPDFFCEASTFHIGHRYSQVFGETFVTILNQLAELRATYQFLVKNVCEEWLPLPENIENDAGYVMEPFESTQPMYHTPLGEFVRKGLTQRNAYYDPEIAHAVYKKDATAPFLETDSSQEKVIRFTRRLKGIQLIGRSVLYEAQTMVSKAKVDKDRVNLLYQQLLNALVYLVENEQRDLS